MGRRLGGVGRGSQLYPTHTPGCTQSTSTPLPLQTRSRPALTSCRSPAVPLHRPGLPCATPRSALTSILGDRVDGAQQGWDNWSTKPWTFKDQELHCTEARLAARCHPHFPGTSAVGVEGASDALGLRQGLESQGRLAERPPLLLR